MRVLVCGGRDFTDYNWLYCTMVSMQTYGEMKIDMLIFGDARGADKLAKRYANEDGIPYLPFPADWKKHGRAAGPIRNQQMIDEGKPDHVVAFPGGRGTADMVRRARAAGIPVTEIVD